MILSDLDKREFCARCGWVGREAFQRDRHDLCEAPVEDPPSDDGGDEAEDEGGSEDEEDRPRWSRADARRRGIPPKKTLAVRRITQVELAAGRAELLMLGADASYDRPRLRGHCRWCPVCQLVRDGKSDGRDQVALQAVDRRAVDDERREEEGDQARTRLARGTGQTNGAVVVRRRKKDNEGPLPAPTDRLACGHLPAEVVHRSRPCVFVACSKNLFLDVSDTGSIILNFPHLEPGQMPADQSCSLDLADRGGMTLEDIAIVTNLTRERIRQIELKAIIRRARPAAIALGLGKEDADAAGTRRQVGPGADLAETGIDGELPSDIATILAGGS